MTESCLHSRGSGWNFWQRAWRPRHSRSSMGSLFVVPTTMPLFSAAETSSTCRNQPFVHGAGTEHAVMMTFLDEGADDNDDGLWEATLVCSP